MILLILNLYKVKLLQNPLFKDTLLIISIASPLLVGVYRDNILIRTFSSELKTSESLLPFIKECMDNYTIEKIIYTQSPGSYMAIKLTYIMLKTIEITKGIKCFGCSAFSLNGNQPIKAMGNLYFIKEKKTIITKKYEQLVSENFILPHSIQDLKINEESQPEYILPAV